MATLSAAEAWPRDRPALFGRLRARCTCRVGVLVATIRVRRGTDSAGLFRRMVIEVDGAVVARLRPKGEEIIELAAGRHVVRARMDWTSSAPVEVQLEEGDQVELLTSLPWTALSDMILSPNSALILRRD